MPGGDRPVRNEQQFSNLIYEYFLLKIHFGYYKYGSILPSIETLCCEFSVSAQTVKAALQRLRAEGYIAMHNGRPTKVLYQETEQEREDFVCRHYSLRSDAFPDLYRAWELVIIPLLAEGIRRVDDDDLLYIDRLAERAGSSELMFFYCFTLQKLENPLVMNLFWETALFQSFPFMQATDNASIYNTSAMQASLKGIITCKKSEDWIGIERILHFFQRKGFNEAFAYIQTKQCLHPVAPEEQIPFTWRIYRNHPQICYSLALHLLHDIYMGEYRGQEFLPSYENMAEKYGASVSTIRRTVRLLSQLGVAQSINGRGTRIFSIGPQIQEPDFTSPGVRRNLAFFYQAFELIIYSCETVTQDTLLALTPAEKSELLSQLETYLATGRCELSLWCILITIGMRSPLKTIQEIYRKLYGLFLWGYPLKASNSELSVHDKIAMQFTSTLIATLKTDDAAQSAKLVKALVKQLFPYAERYLYKHGIKPEELRISPSIRLLLTHSAD